MESGSAVARLRSAAGAPPPQGAGGEAGKNAKLGFAAALGAALFAGLIPTVAKGELGSVDPLLIGGFTNLIAGLALLPLAPRPTFAPGDRPRLLFIALAGVVVGPALYFTGLRNSLASEGAVLVNVETVFTFGLAVLVLRERAGRTEAAAVLAVITGAFVLTTGLSPSIEPAHLAGNLLIIAATFAWAFDNTVSTGLSARNAPQQVATWKNLAGAPIVLAGALLFGADLGPAESALGWIAVVGLGIAVSLTLFYVALRHIGAYRTSAIFGLQGLFGALGAFVFLGERLSPVQVAAAALMIGAVLLLALVHKQSSKGTPPEGGAAR